MDNYTNHPLAGRSDIDSAFSGTWEFYKSRFVPLYSISFIMALIVSIVSSRIDISGMQNTTDITVMLGSLRSAFGVYMIVMLISLFFNTLLYYFVINENREEEFNFIEASVKVISRYYLPLLIVFIVLAVFALVAMMLGALVFIVGLFFAIPYVMIFFAIVTPIMMIEDIGIGDTLSRVFTLAHKRFWSNMGWISVFIVLVFFFSFIVNALIMLPFTGSLFRSLTDPAAATEAMEIAKKPAFILLTSLTSAITTPFLPIIGVVLYFNNRSAEGSGPVRRTDSEEDNQVTVDDLTP